MADQPKVNPRMLSIALAALAIWNVWLTAELSDVRRRANEAPDAADTARRALNRANEAYNLAVDAEYRGRR